MELLPPRGGTAPALGCSRLLRFPDPSTQCPNEATWHVIWRPGPEISSGLCCEAHMVEARGRWLFYAAHRWEPTCSMVGVARYLPPPDNRCVVGLMVGVGYDDTDMSLDEFEDLAAKALPAR